MGKLTFKRILALLGVYARMDLASLLRDTSFALYAITADTIANISGISGIFLLAWRFDGIGGMGKYEVLFMLAFANIVNGLLQIAGGCNALYVSRIIGRGQWEHMFIMPLPFGVQLMIGIFPFTCMSNFFTGIILMIISVIKLGLVMQWWWLPVFVGYVVVAAIVYIALSYLASSLAFYAPVQCEEISSYVLGALSHTSTFPLSGMPRFLLLPLLTVLPAGLIAWFPSLVLLGKRPLDLSALLPVFVALILSLSAAYFFKKGFRYYVKKGINRYIWGGHRS